MSNILYLTCRLHPTHAESFVLVERGAGDVYRINPRHSAIQFQERFAKWLEKHGACGGGFDHFTASYAFPKDNELPSPNPVAEGVQLAIAKERVQ